MNNKNLLLNSLALFFSQCSLVSCMHHPLSDLKTHIYNDKERRSLTDLSVDAFIKKIIAMKIQTPENLGLTIKRKIVYEKFTEKFSTVPTEIVELLWQGVNKTSPDSKLITSRRLLALNKDHSLAVLSSAENVDSGDLYDWPLLQKIRDLNASAAVFCDDSTSLAYINSNYKRVFNITDSCDKPASAQLKKLHLTTESPIVKSLFPYKHLILLKHAAKNNIYLWNSNQTGDKWSSFNNVFGEEIEAICHYTGYICYGQEDKDMYHNIYIKKLNSFLSHLTLKKFEDQITDLTYASGLLAGSSYDKTVRVWDVFNTHKCCLILHHPAPVEVARLSPIGRYLASGTLLPHGKLYIWDLRMNKQFHTVSIESTPSAMLKTQYPDARPSINYLSFDSANTKLVAQAEDAGNFQLFEIELAGNLKLLKIEAERFFNTSQEE